MLSGRLTSDEPIVIPEQPHNPPPVSWPVITVVSSEGHTVLQIRVPRETLDALDAQDVVEVQIVADDE